MEPLTALGIAGNVIQFVQFAAALLDGSRKIYASASGASNESESLENVYGNLAAFSYSLKAATREKQTATLSSVLKPAPGSFGITGYAPQLHSLAIGCETDCNRLLGIVHKLNAKTKPGPGWWKSFQVALLEAVKTTELKELRQRINEYQGTMVLLFCAISK
jgi:hypothetical protein